MIYKHLSIATHVGRQYPQEVGNVKSQIVLFSLTTLRSSLHPLPAYKKTELNFKNDHSREF